ncbi:Verru_Chthon cassette protein A [Prosthecobacter sp.]|uniref:Verru_Chthon cassette protein A n=1 Tax=Prosthecobacter sp. TaxID=1965333 RepID=UPI0037836FBC
MNAAQFSQARGKRRKAMALVMVITVVALMSILIVAIFSVTRMEYKSTQAFVAGKSAKQLADIGTAIVQAQIENGQSTSTSLSARTTHATQPGMVRVYSANGSFSAAYKLYSSSIMKVTGSESSLYSNDHIPPSNWNTMPARYVDLNEPVTRPGIASGTYAVYFPVLDPRAAWNYGGGGQGLGAVPGNTQVEGFSYTKTAPSVGSGGGQDYSAQVVTPTDTSNPDNLRLPMPVEWLYILEDGTVGALDASNKFISSGANSPTADNPIVGRIAFWTDDESCKVNINTAAEPTFMNSPFYFHERDSKWAHFPPVTGEYQRYPGHPATVALSAVLAPNYQMDPLLPALDGFSSYMDVVNLKEKIYRITPKISPGGSEEGTRPFAQDDFSGQNGERSSAVAIDLTTTSKTRLYASGDEILFADSDYSSQTGRYQTGYAPSQNSSGQTGIKLPNGTDLINHDIVERSRFFLTAQSRSPEFNIHGLPRVCIWPVADENALGPQWRTSFDNLIAYCSTIQKNSSSSSGYNRSYIFRRANSRNGSSDLNISRNTQLLDYLVDQMSQLTWPATSYNSNSSYSNYVSKYGQDNVNQLAIQFFDYIRCTNLYDGITSRNNDAWGASGSSIVNLYSYRDSNVSNCYTFTSQRISPQPNSVTVSGDSASSNQQAASAQGGILPGHGQVSPAIWSKGGRSYKGFGRMFTLSEIGFQFICTADGQTDGGSLTNSPWTTAQANGHGGGTSVRYGVNPGEGNIPNASAYPNMSLPPTGNSVWYSNFPPLTQAGSTDKAMTFYGCKANKLQPTIHPSKHPGFYPQNWNMTLADGIPLAPTEKRIQVMLLLETFCPSLGYTGFYPEFTIVLDGSSIAQMQVNGTSLFNTTGDIPIKSYNNIYSIGRTADILGGHASPTSIAGGRHTRQISNGGGTVLMPKDINYDINNTSGHNALQNYAFCSDFITVNRNAPLTVNFPSGDIKVSIYDTHNWESASPVQVLYVNFGSLSPQVPVPNLASSHPYTESIDSFGRIVYTRSRQGPHDWVANYEGCVGRLDGTPNPNYGLTPGQPFWSVAPFPNAAANSTNAQGGREAQSLRGRLDTSNLLIQETRVGVTAVTLPVIAPDGNSGATDVVRSIVPAMGDYRTLAARYNVPSSWWRPHPYASNSSLYQAHSFTSSVANTEPGCKLAQSSADNTTTNYNTFYAPGLQLIGGARFDIAPNGTIYNGVHPRQADLPPGADYATAANAFGDFDTGISNAREGPYINKPDEGNFYAGNETLNSQTKFFRSAYFFNTFHNADDWRSGIYMTPNRMIASPVMFGSLPTGVWGNPSGLPTGSNANGDFAPWQTLLFRPHAQVTSQEPNSQSSHPGMSDPSDHYLLDLFFMPVVEPYAISEPLSIAGRINMNYQIMPFTNIRRATGMHAVMKGEFITAIPNGQITSAKEYYPTPSGSSTAAWDQRYWNDSGDKRYWHRPIDVPATLRQFDLKFSHQSGGQDTYQGLFRSASQICEMHLVPKIKSDGSGTYDAVGVVNASNQGQINDIMSTFWSNNRPTGDNVRERPYSNLYARLTTRTNTFRVHVRTQVLKKARSTDPTIFDPTKDAVISEYRGSTLLERYIDPNDTSVTIPDYAASGISQTPLESFYRFHALETKRFNP